MKKKVITTIGLFVLLMIIVMLGIKVFSLVMGILSILSLLELYNYKYKDNNIIKIIGIIMLLFLVLNGVFYDISIPLIYIIVFLVLLIPYIFIKDKYSINDIMYIYGIILFLGISYNVLIGIYRLSIIRCVYVILIGIMVDLYSYIGTKLIGKHYIKDTNRTIEGSIFGIIMASFIGTVLHYNLIGENILIVIIISMLLSTIGIVGDILFYNIKKKIRKNDYKYKLIDQFDSIILIALLYVIIISII